MRTAVLVLNYILVGLLGLNIIALTSQTQAEITWSVISIVMFTPFVVVNLIYAHSTRPKK